MLERDLNRLRLDGKLICDRGSYVDILLNKYGATRGSTLIAYMKLREGFTKEQLISNGHLNRQEINYRERLITAAGIAVQTCEKVELPPLSIDL